jgi:hypothetical protein
MFKQGDVISYLEMCQYEGISLQRGMNFHLRNNISVILMSLRQNAPYADRIQENGRLLIYEGHDVSLKTETPNPKIVDQPMYNPGGSLTQNGLFYEAVIKFKEHKAIFEFIRVYEKILSGIWTYNGLFKLVDAWQELSNNRQVFKFKLEMIGNNSSNLTTEIDIEHSRVIPASVKLEVWKRDKGCCVKCGSHENLHFDHIIPYSKGGSSLVAENIQLLCIKHNLQKRDNIE